MDTSLVAKHCVELRLLRYAIAVAEELHFGRAARRLNLSAPALSKQIKDLEFDLGYALFDRRTREVLLTPAGTAFVREAREVLVRLERAVECGYAASRAEAGTFSIGYSPWFRPSALLGLQPVFATRVPKTRLALHSAYSATQIELVLNGALQAGIVELPAHGQGLHTQSIWHDELVVALSENHPLAGSSKIDRQDLEAEPIIWVTKSLNPALHCYLLESCRKFGYVPHVTHEINTLSELLDLVAAGAGVSFVKRAVADRVNEPGVAFRAMSEQGLFIDTGIAYRADNRSEALQVVIQLLREHSTR